MNYDEIIKYLDNIPKYGKKTGVVRAGYLLERLGHPEKNTKIIHVAGTNGKGSVCAYLSHIIEGHGYHVGLFVSPHLVKINERIQVDNLEISDELFTEAFHVIYDIKQSMAREGLCELTYFDYLFGMAMYVFDKLKLEYVILETGLGGRLDSTNAVECPILSIITSISLDHTEVLGETIGQIAYEKAGIIKERVPVVYLNQSREASEVIEDTVKRVNVNEKEAWDALCIEVSDSQWEILKNNGKHIDFLVHNRYYKSSMFSINSAAEYQVMNCVIALNAIKVMEDHNKGSFSLEAVQKSIFHTSWEGRMEQIMSDVYIDGAHNPDGIRTFIHSLHSIMGNRTCSLLFSVVKDKHYDEMIQIICESGIFDKLIVTQLEGARKLDSEEIRKQFARYTRQPIVVFDTVQEAFEYGVSDKKDNLLACAGSLYLVGAIKQIMANEDSSQE